MPSTDQNLKYFQTGLFRLLGVQTTLSAAKLCFSLCICHGFSRVSFSAVSDACKCDSCDLSLTLHIGLPHEKQLLMYFFPRSNINVHDSVFFVFPIFKYIFGLGISIDSPSENNIPKLPYQLKLPLISQSK